VLIDLSLGLDPLSAECLSCVYALFFQNFQIDGWYFIALCWIYYMNNHVVHACGILYGLNRIVCYHVYFRCMLFVLFLFLMYAPPSRMLCCGLTWIPLSWFLELHLLGHIVLCAGCITCPPAQMWYTCLLWTSVDGGAICARKTVTAELAYRFLEYLEDAQVDQLPDRVCSVSMVLPRTFQVSFWYTPSILGSICDMWYYSCGCSCSGLPADVLAILLSIILLSDCCLTWNLKPVSFI
jgi:hypothetical protein